MISQKQTASGDNASVIQVVCSPRAAPERIDVNVMDDMGEVEAGVGERASAPSGAGWGHSGRVELTGGGKGNRL